MTTSNTPYAEIVKLLDEAWADSKSSGRELLRPAARAIEALEAEVGKLKEVTHLLGARAVYLCDNIEDEGDRCYLSSTNDVEKLREAKDLYDSYRWVTGDMGPDDVLTEASAIRSRSNATGEDKDGLTAQRTAPSPISQEGSIAPEALSEDGRIIKRPLRYEPDGYNGGPAIKDALGQLVAALFWPSHNAESTPRAEGELHLIASRWVDTANGIDTDDDQVYELGVRDGYMEAVQDIDLRTGGDGEFYGSTIPGRGQDVPSMLEGIVERFEAKVAPPPVQTGAVGSVPGEIADAARFLIDRLHELEWSDLDVTFRDFCGHVEPAIGRVQTALAELTRSPQTVGGGE